MSTRGSGPYIIPVFIPFKGCPNKCIFCNQNVVTGLKEPALPEREELLGHFQEFLSYSGKQHKRMEIAFFGGNFLGMEKGLVIKYLEIAKEFISFHGDGGIRFSTRPDTINFSSLKLLDNYPVKTIELGIQSMDGTVLKKAGRGHSTEDSIKAVELIKTLKPDVDLGLQIMPGLPGDTRRSLFKTLLFIKKSKPEYLRIYPTLVLKNSGLENLFKKGLYKPLELDTAVEISSVISDFCKRHNITIIRMGLPPEGAANNDIIAGPWHSTFGEMVASRSFYKKVALKIRLLDRETKKRRLRIKINPSFESSARGWKNLNRDLLKARFAFKEIVYEKDTNLKNQNFLIDIL